MTERTTGAMELTLKSPLLQAMQCCETNCVAGCCGLDAFDYSPEHLRPWVRANVLGSVWEALDQLADVLHQVVHHSGYVGSNDMNATWDTPEDAFGHFAMWRSLIHTTFTEITSRSLDLDPSWRTSDVVALARGIYEERAFDRLPVLADALQDAGCDHPDVLAHCRDAGPHARGCWVVDLVLGKT